MERAIVRPCGEFRRLDFFCGCTAVVAPAPTVTNPDEMIAADPCDDHRAPRKE